jgi:hypothetical protein
MVRPLNPPPEWASDSHIGNGGTHHCHHCFTEGDGCHELEVQDNQYLATWRGVNWENGFEEKVECPNCGRSGQLKTKLMDSHRERTKFIQLGAAAPVTAEADSNS